MSEYQKAQTDLYDVLSEYGHSSATIEKLLNLVDYIDNQQQRIRELESIEAAARKVTECLASQVPTYVAHAILGK